MIGIRSLLVTCVLTVLGTGVATAQPSQGEPQKPAGRSMRLTLDEAVRMAFEHNLDIAVDRLEPPIAATRVRQAFAAFNPALTGAVGRSHQVTPPTNFLAATTDGFTSTISVGQRLRWGGGSVTASWNATRQTTNSFISNFNPNLGSQLQLSFSQPLLKDVLIDSARQQLVVSKRNREITDTRFRETVVRTLADVKKAYWDLVASRASVDVQQRALQLAHELVRTNTARVDVGQAPSLDLVSAQAEQAQREENLLVAEVQVKQTEDRLRLLVFDPGSASFWTETIEPVDAPPIGAPLPEVDQVVVQAMQSRQDLVRARLDVANAQTGVKLSRSQRLPDLRLQATYGTAGIAGRKIIRDGFLGPVTGTSTTGFGNALDQVFNRLYPTWSVNLSLTYPLGFSYDQAALANARVQEAQARLRLESAEIKAVRQLRQAAWQLEANVKRIETTRATRAFAEQRLDAEQKRFEVGMSTSFLVIQAQRDLALARNNELAARLEFTRALVDFEALQEAGPATSSGSTMTVSGSSIVSFGAPTTGTTTGASGTASTSGRPGGI